MGQVGDRQMMEAQIQEEKKPRKCKVCGTGLNSFGLLSQARTESGSWTENSRMSKGQFLMQPSNSQTSSCRH